MKAMNTAQQVRDRMSDNSRVAQKVAIYKAKDVLDRAIEKAIEANMTQCSTILPEMDARLSNELASTLRQRGYNVTLRQVGGYLSTNLVRLPQTEITVSWANAQ